MAASASAYFTLAQPPSHKPSRRSPLTPPCVSPAAVTTCNTRPEINRSQTTPRATALLSKVVRSSSPASRRGSNASSPPSSPEQEKLMLGVSKAEHGYAYREKENQRPRGEWNEELKYWRRGSEGQDGYISFPDFERYCPQYEDVQADASSEQSQRT